MNTNDDVQISIREFILTQFPLAQQREIADDDSLLVGGIVDSLGILEIVTFLEEKFEITVSTEEMLAENFDSIANLTGLVLHKMQMDESKWIS